MQLLKLPTANDNLLNEKKVTMLVNSCDAYSDVLPLFYAALDEYWPNRNFEVIINTESSKLLNYSEEKKKTRPWGARLLDILKKVETEFVIMVFDDFILESDVLEKEINAALNMLERDKKASVFYLNATCLSSHEDDSISEYRILKDKVDYRLNSNPAVWRKCDLMQYTKPSDNPWVWEVFGSYRTFGLDRIFYSTSSVKNNLFKYDFRKGGAIYRGKWVRGVVAPKLKKYGLSIDESRRGYTSDLENEKRNILWKVRFLLIGFKTIGFKTFYFIYRSVVKKLYGKS